MAGPEQVEIVGRAARADSVELWEDSDFGDAVLPDRTELFGGISHSHLGGAGSRIGKVISSIVDSLSVSLKGYPAPGSPLCSPLLERAVTTTLDSIVHEGAVKLAQLRSVVRPAHSASALLNVAVAQLEHGEYDLAAATLDKVQAAVNRIPEDLSVLGHVLRFMSARYTGLCAMMRSNYPLVTTSLSTARDAVSSLSTLFTGEEEAVPLVGMDLEIRDDYFVVDEADRPTAIASLCEIQSALLAADHAALCIATADYDTALTVSVQGLLSLVQQLRPWIDAIVDHDMLLKGDSNGWAVPFELFVKRSTVSDLPDVDASSVAAFEASLRSTTLQSPVFKRRRGTMSPSVAEGVVQVELADCLPVSLVGGYARHALKLARSACTAIGRLIEDGGAPSEVHTAVQVISVAESLMVLAGLSYDDEDASMLLESIAQLRESLPEFADEVSSMAGAETVSDSGFSDWDESFSDNAGDAPLLSLVAETDLSTASAVPEDHRIPTLAVRLQTLPSPPELLSIRTIDGQRGHADGRFVPWLDRDIISVGRNVERTPYNVLLTRLPDAQGIEECGRLQLAVAEAASKEGNFSVVMEVAHQFFSLVNEAGEVSTPVRESRALSEADVAVVDPFDSPGSARVRRQRALTIGGEQSPETRVRLVCIGLRFIYLVCKFWTPAMDDTLADFKLSVFNLGDDDGSSFLEGQPRVFGDLGLSGAENMAAGAAIEEVAVCGFDSLFDDIEPAPFQPSTFRTGSIRGRSATVVDEVVSPTAGIPRSAILQCLLTLEHSMLAHHVHRLEKVHQSMVVPGLLNVASLTLEDVAARHGLVISSPDVLADLTTVLASPEISTKTVDGFEDEDEVSVAVSEFISSEGRAAAALTAVALVSAGISPLTLALTDDRAVDSSISSDSSDDTFEDSTENLPDDMWVPSSPQAPCSILLDDPALRTDILMTLTRHLPVSMLRSRALYAVALSAADAGELTRAESAIYEALYGLSLLAKNVASGSPPPLLSEVGCAVLVLFAEIEVLRQKVLYGIKLYEAAATLYTARGKTDSAERLYRRVTALATQRHDWSTAVEYYQRLLTAATARHDRNEVVYVAEILSSVLQKQGDIEGAERRIDGALGLLSEKKSAPSDNSSAASSVSDQMSTVSTRTNTGGREGLLTQLEIRRAALRLDAGDIAGGIMILQRLRRLDLSRSRQDSVLQMLCTSLLRVSRIAECAEVLGVLEKSVLPSGRLNACMPATVKVTFSRASYSSAHHSADASFMTSSMAHLGTRGPFGSEVMSSLSADGTLGSITGRDLAGAALRSLSAGSLTTVLSFLDTVAAFYDRQDRVGDALLALEVSAMLASAGRRFATLARLRLRRAEVLSSLSLKNTTWPLIINSSLSPGEPAAALISRISLADFRDFSGVDYLFGNEGPCPIGYDAKFCMLQCAHPCELAGEVVAAFRAAQEGAQLVGDRVSAMTAAHGLVDSIVRRVFPQVLFEGASIDSVSDVSFAAKRVSVLASTAVDCISTLARHDSESEVDMPCTVGTPGPAQFQPVGAGQLPVKLDLAWLQRQAASVTQQNAAHCTDPLTYVSCIINTAKVIHLRASNPELAASYFSLATSVFYSYYMVGPLVLPVAYARVPGTTARIIRVLRSVVEFGLAVDGVELPVLFVDALHTCEAFSRNGAHTMAADVTSCVASLEAEDTRAASAPARSFSLVASVADGRAARVLQPWVHFAASRCAPESPSFVPQSPQASIERDERLPGERALASLRRLRALQRQLANGEQAIGDTGATIVELHSDHLAHMNELRRHLVRLSVAEATSLCTKGLVSSPMLAHALESRAAVQRALVGLLESSSDCSLVYSQLLSKSMNTPSNLTVALSLDHFIAVVSLTTGKRHVKRVAGVMEGSVPMPSPVPPPPRGLGHARSGSRVPTAPQPPSPRSMTSRPVPTAVLPTDVENYTRALFQSARSMPYGPAYELKLSAAWEALRSYRKFFGCMATVLEPFSSEVSSLLRAPSDEEIAEIRGRSHSMKVYSAGTLHLEALNKWTIALRDLTSNASRGFVTLVAPLDLLVMPWDHIMEAPVHRFLSLASVTTRLFSLEEPLEAVTARPSIPAMPPRLFAFGARSTTLASVKARREWLASRWSCGVEQGPALQCPEAIAPFPTPLLKPGQTAHARRRKYPHVTVVESGRTFDVTTLFTKGRGRSLSSSSLPDSGPTSLPPPPTTVALMTVGDLLECSDALLDLFFFPRHVSILFSPAGRTKVLAKLLQRVFGRAETMRGLEIGTSSFALLTASMSAQYVTGTPMVLLNGELM